MGHQNTQLPSLTAADLLHQLLIITTEKQQRLIFEWEGQEIQIDRADITFDEDTVRIDVNNY